MNYTLFEKFSRTIGPSGKEEAVIELFIKEAAAYVDKYYVDSLGNLYCYVNGELNNTVAIIAHADQIGFMVNHIEDNGMIRLASIGTFDIPSLQGTPVSIIHKQSEINGIFAAPPAFYFQLSLPSNISDLYVDIGAKNKGIADQFVSIGDYAVFTPRFTQIGTDYITCTAADNRSGVYILLETLRNLHNNSFHNNIVFILSVQEELGARGASTIPYHAEAEEFIVVDVTHATDISSINLAKYGDIQLDHGIVLPRGSNLSHHIQDKLITVAEASSIPYQIEARPTSSGTDAKSIQLANGGMKTGLISIPCRYIHSPVETVSAKDIDSAISLLTNYCINAQ